MSQITTLTSDQQQRLAQVYEGGLRRAKLSHSIALP